jgi:membrane protein YqaA with SNARE-associated domain
MTTVKLPDDPLALPDDAASREARKADAWKIAVQLVVGITLFCGAVFFAAAHFRAELEAASRFVVERFGLAGLFLGPFVADAFSVPAPPQLYLLAAITTHQPAVLSVTLVAAGSVLGGNVGRWLGFRLGDRPLLERLLGGTRARVDAVFARYGYWAVAVGALMPLPYSMLCYLAGVYRMPKGLFALMSLLRVPRLVFFYYVLRAGFGA